MHRSAARRDARSEWQTRRSSGSRGPSPPWTSRPASASSLRAPASRRCRTLAVNGDRASHVADASFCIRASQPPEADAPVQTDPELAGPTAAESGLVVVNRVALCGGCVDRCAGERGARLEPSGGLSAGEVQRGDGGPLVKLAVAADRLVGVQALDGGPAPIELGDRGRIRMRRP